MTSSENDKSPQDLAERYVGLLGELASQADAEATPKELDEVTRQLVGKTATITTVDGSKSIEHWKHRYVIAGGVMWWERVRPTNHAKGTIAGTSYDKTGRPRLIIKRAGLLGDPRQFNVHPVDSEGNPLVSIEVSD